MNEKKRGRIIDADKVKRLLAEKHIERFSCGLINDVFNTMGREIEAKSWNGEDFAEGWVFSQTWGIAGIQDQDGNLYPAYREMTRADIDQADEGHEKLWRQINE
ncbi:hypothetical protein [Lentilactobacillus otakiensis]|uniref:hypothetical protein n=1 Tax=Lentilactobacillus otakiensis TaxID=481720 RepID=UPI003D185A10